MNFLKKREALNKYKDEKLLNLEERKKIALDILKYIKKICEKNDIKYFLAYGTLIGAVRHKGFIPWDDDIDICLLYSDYIKLINILKKDDNYNLISPYTNDNCYYCYSKLVDKSTFLVEENLKVIDNMGIFVDIFPLYNLPNGKFKRKTLVKRLTILNKIAKRQIWTEHYYDSTNVPKSIVKAILFFPEYIYCKMINVNKKILNMAKKYNNTDSGYVSNLPTDDPSTAILEKNIFSDTVNISFEKIYFKAPIKYDEFLCKIYGDYLKLPPVEERCLPHVIKAWKRIDNNNTIKIKIDSKRDLK